MRNSPAITARRIRYAEIRASMAKLGYHPLRPILLNRWMRYRLLIVAVNHLATLIHKDPYRTYQALLCRAERTARGTPYTPYKQTQLDPAGVREWDEKGGLHVFCPCCGADLLECGKVTKAEVMREIAARKSRNSPHNS